MAMTKERLHELLEENSDKQLIWKGICHDCNQVLNISATPRSDGIRIEGGAVFEPEREKFYLKCEGCHHKDPILREYQDCEVYSRVVGYLRPVKQWNPGKQAEYGDREMFEL